MIRNADGSMSGLLPTRLPGGDPSMKQQHSLLNAETLTAEDVKLLEKCLDNYIEHDTEAIAS